MFLDGNEVDAVHLVVAVDALLNFFQKFQSKVVLVGHNVKSFDCHIFINSLQNCGKIQEFANCVAGFVDTKHLFKVFYPKLCSFSLENLYKHNICEAYKAHDALEDFLALQKLVTFVGVDLCDPKYLSSSFTSSNAVNSHCYSLEVRKNLPSLEHLISEKNSRQIATRIAGSGLCFHFLQLAYNRDNKDGMHHFLSENVNEGPRVTKSLKICSSYTLHQTVKAKILALWYGCTILLSIHFSSPETKAQVSFSDQNLFIICCCCCVIVVVNFSHFISFPRTTRPISTNLAQSILGRMAFKFVQVKGLFPFKGDYFKLSNKTITSPAGSTTPTSQRPNCKDITFISIQFNHYKVKWKR